MSENSKPNSEVNPQVMSAIQATNELVMCTARSQSQALAYEGLASAVNLMLLNASHNQFGAQKIEVAMVAATCARILKAGA